MLVENTRLLETIKSGVRLMENTLYEHIKTLKEIKNDDIEKLVNKHNDTIHWKHFKNYNYRLCEKLMYYMDIVHRGLTAQFSLNDSWFMTKYYPMCCSMGRYYDLFRTRGILVFNGRKVWYDFNINDTTIYYKLIFIFKIISHYVLRPTIHTFENRFMYDDESFAMKFNELVITLPELVDDIFENCYTCHNFMDDRTFCHIRNPINNKEYLGFVGDMDSLIEVKICKLHTISRICGPYIIMYEDSRLNMFISDKLSDINNPEFWHEGNHYLTDHFIVINDPVSDITLISTMNPLDFEILRDKNRKHIMGFRDVKDVYEFDSEYYLLFETIDGRLYISPSFSPAYSKEVFKIPSTPAEAHKVCFTPEPALLGEETFNDNTERGHEPDYEEEDEEENPFSESIHSDENEEEEEDDEYQIDDEVKEFVKKFNDRILKRGLGTLHLDSKFI